MKPPTAAGYGAEQLEQVRSVCLYVATKLADLRDDWVIIGGLVPSLLIDQQRLNAVDRHVGTLDVDLGLQLGILAEEGYREITARLREAGFGPDSNEAGNLVRQRWKHSSTELATVEFLIPPATPGQHGGSLQNLERDFAAVVAPGVDLAFRDRRLVTLSGRTVLGENASREAFVCGAGTYVVLKALAFAGRHGGAGRPRPRVPAGRCHGTDQDRRVPRARDGRISGAGGRPRRRSAAHGRVKTVGRSEAIAILTGRTERPRFHWPRIDSAEISRPRA